MSLENAYCLVPIGTIASLFVKALILSTLDSWKTEVSSDSTNFQDFIDILTTFKVARNFQSKAEIFDFVLKVPVSQLRLPRLTASATTWIGDSYSTSIFYIARKIYSIETPLYYAKCCRIN